MAKKRIHQIAKELDVASADILFLSKELGIEVKTASSGLTPEEEELVVLAFNEKNSVTESTNNDEVETSETVDESEVLESETQTLVDAESMPVEEEVDIQIIEVSSGATPEEPPLRAYLVNTKPWRMRSPVSVTCGTYVQFTPTLMFEKRPTPVASNNQTSSRKLAYRVPTLIVSPR